MKLYLCNTPYQIIVAMQIALSVNRNQKNLILITDTVPAAEKVAANLKKTGGFFKAFAVKTKGISWKENMFQFPVCFKYDSILKKQLEESGIYGLLSEVDEYYFANVSGFAASLGLYLRRKKKNRKFSMYEDGVSSYSGIYEDAVRYRIHNENPVKRIRFAVFPSILKNVDRYYVFSPELMVWKCPYNVTPIPSIKKNIEEIRSALNSAFDYYSLSDSYEEKVIFFEESYVEDGIPVNDLEIVHHLEEKYGKNNIFIKSHPRVSVNRFQKQGFKTNSNTSVPWEVIALNKDLDSKVLVTMTSTAVVNSYFLFQTQAEMIFEYEALRNESNKRIVWTIEVIDRLKELFPEKFTNII